MILAGAIKLYASLNRACSFILSIGAALVCGLSAGVSEVNADPFPPTAVAATNGSLDSITVSWAAPAAGTAPASYQLYRSQTNQSCVTLIATVPSNQTSFQDTSFPNTNAHYYSLRSVTSGNIISECSNTAAGSASEVPPPNSAENVNATDTLLDMIKITWQLPANTQPITAWRLYKTTQQGLAFCNADTFINIPNPSATSYDDTNVNTNVTYYYGLKSIGPTGISNCSQWNDGKKLEPPPPNPPSNVQASDGTFTDKVRVTWVVPTTGGQLTNFNVFRSNAPDFTCGTGTAIGTVASNITTIDDPTAVPGVIYHYQVQSQGPHGLRCAPTDSGYARPSPPANVSATDGTFTNKVEVTWAPPPGGGNLGSYTLYRNGTCDGAPIATLPNGTLNYSDLAVTPGVIYNYSLKVAAADPAAGTSACSPHDPGHARVAAPPIQATKGTNPSGVLASWTPPPGNVTGYDLYRSDTPTSACQGNPITSPSANAGNFLDTSAVPGVQYFYSIRALSTSGAGLCSPVDNGYVLLSPPVNVSATDGTFNTKVDVTWSPPPAGNIGGYRLYRNANCSGNPLATLGKDATIFFDQSAVPGVIYDYSLVAFGADAQTGTSACSLKDPGHARILPPVPQVTKIDTPDAFNVTWLPPAGQITGYDLYRSENPQAQCQGQPIAQLPSTTLNYQDTNVQPGIQYYYSIKAKSPAGESACSQIDDGFFEREALLSPAFAKFNTYLGQWNFAELINQGTKDKVVNVSVFNLRGEIMHEGSILVKAKEQVDLNINSWVQFACDVSQRNCTGFEDLSATAGAFNGLGRPDGVVDTYGLVRFQFDDSDPKERLLGRMSFYRPNTNGTYSFAFAREFRNPLQGTGYGVSNTYDPRGQGYLVPNWAELISFGVRNDAGDLIHQPLGYTVNIYNQKGEQKYKTHVVLQPLAEIDIHGGHEFVDSTGKVIESVYLVEIIPDNPKAEYSLSIARYSSNAPPASDPETYNYALVIDGSGGSAGTVYAPIGNTLEGVLGANENIYADNWVEIACVSSQDCEGTIRFITSGGQQVASQYFKIPAKNQFHFNASAVLPSKTSGSVHITPSVGRVVGQSMTYLHGDKNDLQTAFVSAARTAASGVQSGSINTFLGMQNVLSAISTSGAPSEAKYSISSFSGGVFEGVLGLGAINSASFRISDNSALNFPPNTYGALIITTPADVGLNSEVRRVRVTTDGKVDFVMPTQVK